MDPTALEAAKKRLTEVTELLVKSLVDDESAVKVVPKAIDTLILFDVTVAQSDFKLFLGVQGRNAQALRLFVRAMGRKYKCDAYVKVFDPQGNEYRVLDPEGGGNRQNGQKALR